MGRVLLVLFLLVRVFAAKAQIIDGTAFDSSIITFTGGILPSNFIPDTSSTPLWEVGHSHKLFFGDSLGNTTIMTDTVHPYPINANNWFILKLYVDCNIIIDFWHKYQTDCGKDGGVVEFSSDSGQTWQNIKGNCNIDSNGDYPGIFTSNFYSFTDTLSSGMPAFTGTHDTLFSRFQYYCGPAEAPHGGSGCNLNGSLVYVRFRFISDSIADSMAGWMIDSIKLERDYYWGAVNQVNRHSLNVLPNPSFDGTFIFPAIDNEKQFKISIFNSIGGKIIQSQYTHHIDLSSYPPGMYFYEVTDGVNYYAGRLLKE